MPRRISSSGGAWRWPASATTTPAGSGSSRRSPNRACFSDPTRSRSGWPAGGPRPGPEPPGQRAPRRPRGRAAPGYDGHCRNLTAAERVQRVAQGRPRSIRFRTPDEGTSSFTDVIRGEVTVPWSTIPDFVIVRTSGAPVFYLANAIDDADTGITHVIRGEDLTDTTHRMLALRAALGVEGRPVFAHLPLLVGADRAKLSKRHGAISLEDFAARGYLPEALRNYLGLLAFSLPPAGDESSREIVALDELVAGFDLSRVAPSPAFFDYDKLDWMNGEYIRALPTAEFVERGLPFGEARSGDRVDP